MIVSTAFVTCHDLAVAVAWVLFASFTSSAGPPDKWSAAVKQFRILLIGHRGQETESVCSLSFSFALSFQEFAYFANGLSEMFAVISCMALILPEKVSVDLGRR